jgi:hypothetical protein
VKGAGRTEELLGPAKQASHLGQERCAALGAHEPAPLPHEQRIGCDLTQALQGTAHGWLPDVEPLGRERDALGLEQGAECRKQPEREIFSHAFHAYLVAQTSIVRMP